MKWIDIFRMALGNLRRNRMRTVLTVSGVVVGIGAIVFLVSLGFGLENLMVRQVASLDALTVVTVRPNPNRNILLNKGSLGKLKSLPDVVALSPVVSYPSQIVDGKDNSETIINGVIPKYFLMEDAKISTGKGFSGENAKEVILSDSAAHGLTLKDIKEAIGKEFTFKIIESTNNGTGTQADKSYKLKVVGITSEKSTYVPTNVFADLNPDAYAYARVKTKDRQSAANAKKAIEALGFNTSSVKDQVDQINQAFFWIRIGLGGFGFIALLVAAIGIFNTMTISLLERTHEIGIMKAIGGRNRDVARIFTAEASVIGLLGGIFGLFAGWLLGFLTNQIANFLANQLGGRASSFFYTPATFALEVVLFAFAVSTVAGIWPARRASKLNPLEALRYE